MTRADAVRIAAALIRDKVAGRRGVKDSIPCPLCGELLGFLVYENGHTYARCSTADCIWWLE